MHNLQGGMIANAQPPPPAPVSLTWTWWRCAIEWTVSSDVWPTPSMFNKCPFISISSCRIIHYTFPSLLRSFKNFRLKTNMFYKSFLSQTVFFTQQCLHSIQLWTYFCDHFFFLNLSLSEILQIKEFIFKIIGQVLNFSSQKWKICLCNFMLMQRLQPYNQGLKCIFTHTVRNFLHLISQK